jgi:hypothetical protein
MSNTFETNCDNCGDEFKNDVPLWDTYNELDAVYTQLMLVLNPHGFHEPWFCSEKCQKEAIEAVRQDIAKEKP